jgi:hypothetical protein
MARHGVDEFHNNGFSGKNVTVILGDDFSDDRYLDHGDQIDYIITTIAPECDMVYTKDLDFDYHINKNRPTIINMSYNYRSFDALDDILFEQIKEQLKRWARDGAIIVKSAGNKNLLMGSTLETRRMIDIADEINSDPTIAGCVVIVGSSDMNSSNQIDMISSYSNKAGNGYNHYVFVPCTDIMLPTKYSAKKQQLMEYQAMEGTSFAAPIVVGELCLALEYLSTVSDDGNLLYPTGKDLLTYIHNAKQIPEKIPQIILTHIGQLVGKPINDLRFLNAKHIYGNGEFNMKNIILCKEKSEISQMDDKSSSLDLDIKEVIEKLNPSYLHAFLKNGYTDWNIEEFAQIFVEDLSLKGEQTIQKFPEMIVGFSRRNTLSLKDNIVKMFFSNFCCLAMSPYLPEERRQKIQELQTDHMKNYLGQIVTNWESSDKNEFLEYVIVDKFLDIKNPIGSILCEYIKNSFEDSFRDLLKKSLKGAMEIFDQAFKTALSQSSKIFIDKYEATENLNFLRPIKYAEGVYNKKSNSKFR